MWGFWATWRPTGRLVRVCGSALACGSDELGHDGVDGGSPVGKAVSGSVAGRVHQAERRPGAVRELDVLVGEVDPTSGARREQAPAVVAPAGPDRAWEALVLAKAVLRGPAQGGDVDPGVEQAAGGAGQPAEGGAWEEAAVVGAGRPAVAGQREQHDCLAAAGGGGSHGRH